MFTKVGNGKRLKITKVPINNKAIATIAYLLQMKMKTIYFKDTLSLKYVHILLVP
jgi:hypothetical protein